MNHRRVFYALSAQAIRQGLLTPAARDVIARIGSRKENYWARHLRDLRDVLAERRTSGNQSESSAA